MESISWRQLEIEQRDKKAAALMLIADANYLFAVATMIQGLKRAHKNCVQPWTDIVIIHSGFTEDDMNKLLKIDSNIVFISYSLEDFFEEFSLSHTRSIDAFISRYSHLTFVKSKAFQLLNYYRKVLMLDSDMLLLHDLTSLYEIKGVAWKNGVKFKDKFNWAAGGPNRQHYIEAVSDDWPSPNGGLFYLSEADTISPNACYSAAKRFISEEGVFHGAGADELALSWAVHEEGLTVTALDPREWNCYPWTVSPGVKLIHFMSRNLKPWNNDLVQICFSLWLKDFNAAQEVAPFKNPVIEADVGEFYRSHVTLVYWSTVWRDISSLVAQGFTGPLDWSERSLEFEKGPICYRLIKHPFQSQHRIEMCVKGYAYATNRQILANARLMCDAASVIQRVRESDDELIIQSKTNVSSKENSSFLRETALIAQIVDKSVFQMVYDFRESLSNQLSDYGEVRIWIYESTTVVADFKDDEFGRFAFDFEILDSNVLVSLVARDSSTFKKLLGLQNCGLSMTASENRKFSLKSYEYRGGTTVTEIYHDLIKPTISCLGIE